jgi:hypothetical protein
MAAAARDSSNAPVPRIGEKVLTHVLLTAASTLTLSDQSHQRDAGKKQTHCDNEME